MPCTGEDYMLKVATISQIRPATVEIDHFVPISIVFKEGVQSPLYWRGKQGDRSLFEVGICSLTGTIVSMTLVSIDPNQIVESPFSSELVSGETIKMEGLPIVDMSPWPTEKREYQDSFCDEETALILRIWLDSVQIEIDGNLTNGKWYSSGQVFFGLNDKNMLSAVRITGLTKNEVSILTGFIA